MNPGFKNQQPGVIKNFPVFTLSFVLCNKNKSFIHRCLAVTLTVVLKCVHAVLHLLQWNFLWKKEKSVWLTCQEGQSHDKEKQKLHDKKNSAMLIKGSEISKTKKPKLLPAPQSARDSLCSNRAGTIRSPREWAESPKPASPPGDESSREPVLYL